jgi:hypothetical protein
MNHGWQQKRKCFTTSCCRNSNHILPLESHGPSLTLNRSRTIKALLENFIQDIFRHTRLFKSHTRLGNTLSLDCHLLGGPPSLCFFFRTLGHIRMLNVKVFFKSDEFRLGKVNLGKTAAKTGIAETSSSAAVGRGPRIVVGVRRATSAAIRRGIACSAVLRRGSAAVSAAIGQSVVRTAVGTGTVGSTCTTIRRSFVITVKQEQGTV